MVAFHVVEIIRGFKSRRTVNGTNTDQLLSLFGQLVSLSTSN